VLGGPCPFDPYWVDLMGERGVLAEVGAVGFHGFPGTWDSEMGSWGGWDLHLGEMRSILDRYNPKAEIWVTETGYSTWRNDEFQQARRFAAALHVPAVRVYWYSWRDVPHDVPVQEGFWFDARHYHLGAVEAGGRKKLLARLLIDGGLEQVQAFADLASPYVASGKSPALITGGAGFIGSNLAASLLADGEEVIILDNLSRPGVDENLNWLKEEFGSKVHPFLADIRDLPAIEPAFADASSVFHLAAQTAVTTSLDQPLDDFEVNARGTLNVLEAIRRAGGGAPVIFASTNKVYGSLEDLEMIELEDRYIPADQIIRNHGINEARPLDLCTPYGCSKGAADQYVLDYAKSYGIASAVLRMSCIYGPRQFGTEDQGWVAHFLIQALKGEPITVYGNGKQVRDVLHINDAVSAYRLVRAQIGQVRGEAFNLGGGAGNAVSLHAVLQQISLLHGSKPNFSFDNWRQGDQPYFVADTRKLSEHLGWRAKIGWKDGLADLASWLRHHRGLGVDNAALRRRASA
jgi:CDP-paratose 2-epimerase